MSSPYPHIGSLNMPVIIEQNNPVKNPDNGQVEDNWVIFKKTFAAVDFKTGTEKEEQQTPVSSLSQKFTIRYFPGITVKMRIVYDNENYNIRAIQKIGRNRYLTLTAERIK